MWHASVSARSNAASRRLLLLPPLEEKEEEEEELRDGSRTRSAPMRRRLARMLR